MADTYTDRLSDYLDGDLAPDDTRDLELHVAGCEDCRTTLDELRTVVAAARILEPTGPAGDLWPGIAAQIEAERATDLSAARAKRRAGGRRGDMRRLSFTIPQLAAAAVVLVLASAGSAWMLVRGNPSIDPTGSAPAGSVVPVSTVAAPSTDAELAELEAALADGRRTLDPATVAVLRRNLLIIDQALVEARAALDADPANPYLSRHYENTLNKKRELLQQAGSIARGNT